MLIRFVNTGDAEAMLNIYRPFIEASTTSFETIVPTTVEFAERITTCTQKYPWLAADFNGMVAGYAYASKHRERAAYQWSVETSVYIHPGFYRKGIAAVLYSTLFSLLKQQGFVNAYAGIALPNPASKQLHRFFGFEDIGVYKKIGFKFGRWHDVLWMSKNINEHTSHQSEPKGIDSIKDLLPQLHPLTK